MSIGDLDRRILWVRAGGRCSLCKAYLLEGKLTAKFVPLGEAAHIVAHSSGENAPRADAAFAEDRRDTHNNLMLACANCHTEIDKQIVAETMTVDLLRELKKAHEDEILHLTGLVSDRRTVMLRVHGYLRDSAMVVDADAATTAIIHCGHRFPRLDDSGSGRGFDIDLTALPEEGQPTNGYYTMAAKKIDLAIKNRLADAIERGQISHLSVFAIARLPPLVYLGVALDDGIDTDTYQLHRPGNEWVWPADGTPTTFSTDLTTVGDAGCADISLITNLSGTTAPEQLPKQLRGLTTYTLHADGPLAHEGVIDHPETLVEFEKEVRKFFSMLEADHGEATTVHVFGGLPISAGVTFGRSLKARALRPVVALYDRTEHGYEKALEV
ncbi:SAVED domain-containing protein [Rhodococcus sp. NM-2]|uniref:SAVED domain-containing protein n=1 Tax=Rhodococcus sp. NM-2 TaxID=3401174 RepID=UPI003AAE09DE